MVASISSSTASAWSDALFNKIDTKQQGFIDAEELKSALGTDDAADVSEVLAQLDTDSDGKVTKSELSSAVDSVVEALNAQRDQGRAGPPPPKGPPPAGAGQGEQSYDPADANQDGSVSEAEQAAMDQWSALSSGVYPMYAVGATVARVGATVAYQG